MSIVWIYSKLFKIPTSAYSSKTFSSLFPLKSFLIFTWVFFKSITAMYRFRQSSIYHALGRSTLAQDRWKKMEKVPLYFEGLQLVPNDQK